MNAESPSIGTLTPTIPNPIAVSAETIVATIFERLAVCGFTPVA